MQAAIQWEALNPSNNAREQLARRGARMPPTFDSQVGILSVLYIFFKYSILNLGLFFEYLQTCAINLPLLSLQKCRSKSVESKLPP